MKRGIPGGFLLAIEGIDGAGKSTQADRVTAALRARGLEVVRTREPTDGPWGRRLRESALRGRLSPEEELHAFMEDRRQHVAGLIRPALEAGKIVVTDRYYFSTVAYQGALGFDPVDLLQRNEAFAIEPHLLVILDLPPEEALKRVGVRDGRLSEFESRRQLERCREIFGALDKPYLIRLDARMVAGELEARILFEFGWAAMKRLRERDDLSYGERLRASLRMHGAAEYEPVASSEVPGSGRP